MNSLTQPRRYRPWAWSWLVLLLCAPLTLAQPSLPRLGDEQGMALGAERRLGDRIAQTLYRDPDYIDDPVLGDYLQLLWSPLFAAAQVRGDVGPELAQRFAWTLLLSRDKRINAFALPGGYMGVNLGLIAATDNAPEIASVMAHELSHVSQRHIARLIERQNQQSPWLLGTMILGVLAASANRNVDTANAVILGGQAAVAQSSLGFSREMEREADRVGFGVMTEAGMDGLGFVTMFDKLQQASRLNDDGSFPYLRTHPLSNERMADMRNRLPSVPLLPTWVAPEGLHAAMSARARVLAESSPERWQAWLKQGQLPNSDAASRMLALLSAHRLGLPAQALSGARAWRETAPPALRTVADNLLLEMLLAPGVLRDAQAIQELNTVGTASMARSDRASVLWGAQALQATGQWQVTEVRLRDWVVQHPSDALAWQLLAQAQQAMGLRLAALRAEAESRVAVMDIQGALDRLNAAQSLQRQTPDEWESAIVQTRTRELRRRLDELQRED